ncbi:ArnT family glycosyltransferase [Pseudarthrobacter niigatensis]|uniref:4-amino-4-deoxy-L-arabinose transferase-like glycosyltransferase n=1 Tax=Pseudarthrobacter niigatensis TaxID=369935 RepID=A0AAJ1SVT1_9MICC|nr:glycosyltransferase family 39 protein [Pseudarthrobacter niigatensis]MDQ0147986.1 4-amino-4-deoxy-L-arabinose transferase-like glycosyltransferase [Pseudarthrobacter niigatensis]MDQ0264178.1 4-amino-4-deoxy-L-arabinose transferase-like glycosyltransferase [Pseudarthrobacter niigatensis]
MKLKEEQRSGLHRSCKAPVHQQLEKWAVGALMLMAGLMYVWAVDKNGWANAYYSAAVQAGQHNLQAFLFASADWGNFITVDKPPLSLWVMGVSVRIFGLNSWSLMVPQALMTLASTFLLFRLVRRCFPFSSALFAASAYAFAPITVLMARYNNPDPLMILLMIGALYAGVRAVETGRFIYISLVVLLLVLGFLTKQLQAFLVLPSVAATYLLYESSPWRRRMCNIGIAGIILGIGSLLWPLFVDLMSHSSRPYIGGSTTNSMLELTLGYNGLERILKQADMPSATLIPDQYRSVESDAGFFRLLNTNYGQEIGWILLPALLASIATLIVLIKGSYSRSQSVLVCAASVWTITTYMVLSFMGNNFHSYYTSSLALPSALSLGLGIDLMTRAAKTRPGRIALALSVVVSVVFARGMWQVSNDYPEWLGTAILLMGVGAAAVLTVPAPRRWLPNVANGLAISALMIGPLYCSALTLQSPQEGSNPISGGLTKSPNTLSRFLQGVKNQEPAWATGIAIGIKPGPAMVNLIRQAPASCTWAAATYPGQTAAQYQLSTGRTVMSIGGFAAVDPTPTLEQFQAAVAAGQVCYVIEQQEQLKVPGNSKDLIAIQDWVKANFRAEQVDGTNVYDVADH